MNKKMKEILVALKIIDGERVHILGYFSKDTPPGTYDFYDLYWQGTCINEGNRFYDTIPTSGQVRNCLHCYIDQQTDKEVQKIEDETGVKPMIVKSESLVATPEEILSFELNYMQ